MNGVLINRKIYKFMGPMMANCKNRIYYMVGDRCFDA